MRLEPSLFSAYGAAVLSRGSSLGQFSATGSRCGFTRFYATIDTFRCDRTLDELWAVLNAATPPTWRGGDNGHWGEYLVTSAAPARLRIFRDGDRYVIDISRLEPTPGALEDAIAMARSTMALLGAVQIEPHSGWE